jgi:hypothetical protein
LFSRRHIPLVGALACVLVLAASAQAAPNTFTAALAPAHVKPATATSYTLVLTNGSTADQVDKAKVTIPLDFTTVSLVAANTTAPANSSCVASTWELETPIANGTVQLKRPGGGGNQNLCPDGTLTLTLSAVSPATPGSYTWTPQLFSTADQQPFGSTGDPSVNVDGSPPDTTITSVGPPTPTNQTTASFTFTSTETGSTFECRIDGAAFATCTSPVAFSSLTAGNHTFEVRARDLAGNVDGTPAANVWTIDVTAPNTTINSGPPNPTNATSAQFAFSANEPGSTFECRVDVVNAGAFAPCTSPASYTGLPGGTRTFQVRAKDPAGNTETSPASRTWTIDLTAPNTTINSGPPATTNQTAASFTFTSTETGSTFECRVDAVNAGAFAPCTSPASYTGLPGGTRTFQVRAKDPAGNTDVTPATHTWTIDLVGAATTILTAPPGSTNSTSASFTFTASEQGTTFECSLDGALFSQCASPKAYSSLGDGQHRFAVRAIDSTTNTGPEASHTWNVDTRPPRAAIASGPPALTNSRSAAFAFSADEPTTFQCGVDGGSLVPCSSPASYESLGDGAHTFIAVPTDAVGNPGASASYSWTIDGTAPQTTLAFGPPSQTTAASATFRFTASELAGFQCRLDDAPFAPCSSPKTYSRLRRSRHSFSVRAIDAAGNLDPTPAVRRWTIGALSRTVKASALFAPRAGARLTAPPLLRWRAVARASYYNVQLYRGSVKVLSAWPTRTKLQVRTRWTYLGRQRQLAAGTYRWYVWPGYGRPSVRRYGRLLGESTFTVVARR